MGKKMVTDLSLHTDFLMRDKNLAKMTRGTYYQAGGDNDRAVDPAVSVI